MVRSVHRAVCQGCWRVGLAGMLGGGWLAEGHLGYRFTMMGTLENGI